MNFVSTNDIIGGNSGSPMINKEGEIVGLVFDGNIQSLGGDYGFDESVNRTVAVHSDAIIESLQKIYGASRVLEELRPGSTQVPPVKANPAG
jgi:S1-C subfamily serine protease